MTSPSIRERALCYVHTRRYTLQNEGSIVSFCFDDFPHTAYINGGAILSELHVKATYYVAIGLMNKVGGSGRHFDIDDLHSLVRDGHELASHTFSHISGRKVRHDVFCKDVQRGRNALREMNLPTSGNFAYPYGDATMWSKKALTTVMTSCRSVIPGINGPQVDLNLLRANALYGNVEKLGSVEKLLRQNEAKKGWLIFYTHDVCERPSGFGCTPGLLEAAASRAIEGGNRILTIAEVLTDQRPYN